MSFYRLLFSSAIETHYRFQYSHCNRSAWKKEESCKIVELSKRLSTLATTSMRQIMQTLSTLPVSIVILATRTYKHITHQTQQMISRPLFLRLTVKFLSFLHLTAKFLAVLLTLIAKSRVRCGLTGSRLLLFLLLIGNTKFYLFNDTSKLRKTTTKS